MTQPTYTPEEWEILGGGILQPAMAVAQASGSISTTETLAMYETISTELKAYADNPQIKPLLEQVLSAKAAETLKRYEGKSPDDVLQSALQTLRSALGILNQKSRPEVIAEYKRITLSVSQRVAQASSEQGAEAGITESESEVLAQIQWVLDE